MPVRSIRKPESIGVATCAAIEAVRRAMERYDPSIIGCSWDDTNPRIQIEPKGTRGYIELRAVKPAARRRSHMPVGV